MSVNEAILANGPRGSRARRGSVIPIHRFWIGPPHPLEAVTTAAIRATHPEAVLHDWTAADLDADLDPTDDPRHLSNVMRYRLLYKYGGLWLDHDLVPLTNLFNPKPYTAALRNQREGAVLWFPTPNHPFMARMTTVTAQSDNAKRSPVRSGSQVLTREGRSWPGVGLRHVFACDAAGRPASSSPTVIHAWDTSKRAALQTSRSWFDKGSP